MVLTVPERVAARLREVALARGESADYIAVEILDSSPLLSDVTFASSSETPEDLLEAFIGCGSSGDHEEVSIHELRDELSADQLRR